ncbi:MAG: fatty acid oxidation complex subunit alpha FadJ [Polyangiaceae bacterium]
MSVSRRKDGVAVLVIDDGDVSVNTITEALARELEGHVQALQRDADVVGVVVASGKPASFVVGANLEMLRGVRTASQAERMASDVAQGLRRIEKGTKPFVAAVHGEALGGGFELALACHAIVASDDPKTTFGLPEVRLGLLPAANGLLRVARRAGLQVALDLGLTGKSLRAKRAKAKGLVDEVCPPAHLVDVAAKRALALAAKGSAPPAATRPTSRTADERMTRLALEGNPVGRALLFKKVRSELAAKTRGHYPATVRIVDVLERFAKKGFDAAMRAESEAFGDLVVSSTSRRLVELFFATQELKKDSGVDGVTESGSLPERIVVVGAGLMGAGIASVTVDAKIPVRLRDTSDASIARGLAHVRERLDRRVEKRRATALERDAAWALVTATTEDSGYREADVVVEAVFEDLATKRRVLASVEAAAGPDCVFATNTSSIPVATIAEGARRPENVVGMHYFSPVERMPLLEIVRTDRTSPDVVRRAVALGKKQGKTVIVVRDGVGFYTTRILAATMNEAAHLVAEGVPIEAVDEAMLDWGFPVGPIQLVDEVGIDVAAHVGAIVHDAFGERFAPPGSIAALVRDGRLGKKNGRGFYLYDDVKGAKKAKRRVDPSVYAVLGVRPSAKIPVEEIQGRCALRMVNEAVHCLGDGVLRSPRDGDVGAIFGLGFPPFRGGPFRYVDRMGPAAVLRTLQIYADRFGPRWIPAPRLVELSQRGDTFHGQLPYSS